jgi:hypothetical protein
MLKRTILTAMLSLFLGLIPMVLLSNPASATPASGPVQRVHLYECFPVNFLCLDSYQVIHATYPPTGDTAAFLQEDYTLTYDDGTCRSVTTRSDDTHELYKRDQAADQVLIFRLEETIEVAPCGDKPAQTCTLTVHYVFANGQVRFVGVDDQELPCFPDDGGEP